MGRQNNTKKTMKPSLQEAQQLLIKELQVQGIKQPQVLEAIATIPRHLFIDELFRTCAYENVALPIDCQQTISQPYIVARMSELLLAKGHKLERVLEIGTGSAYQAAVLAKIATQVYSIERIKSLHDSAKQRLQNLGITNVHLLFGDGFEGWQEHAPYDGILITAAPHEVPEKLLDQLAMGGRMILPLEQNGQQITTVIDREEQGVVRHYFDPVRFVPMQSGTLP